MIVAALALVGSQAHALDPALERFLHASSRAARDAAAAEVIDGDMPFERALERLRRGRTYSADAERGRLQRVRTGTNGLEHPYMVLIPTDYDPAVPTPLLLNLHGGMGADEWPHDGSWSPGWNLPRGEIVVLPAGWWDSMWWEHSQADNLESILAEVQRTYNVAEDRVVGYGNSDGGAGVFFLAFRTPDRFAAYAGHVAPPDRLTRADFRVDGQMHLSNLRAQRFHLVYGEKDPKVPLRHLRKYLDLFEQHGAVLDWSALPRQGHSLTLTDEHHRRLSRFLSSSTRDPLPDELTWATERTDRYARRSWLVIDELDPAPADHDVDETNLLPRWGSPIQLRGPTVARVPWGRVELVRDGNTVRATTRRVRRFTLLLSPDEFDLARPVEVVIDGVATFEGSVEPSLEVLLRWSERDDDRRRLFAAELALEVPARPR